MGSKTKTSTRRRLTPIAAAIVLGFGLSACDSSELEDGEFATAEVQDLYTDVVLEAEMTSDQQAAFGRQLKQHDRRDREPGFLWRVADSLAQTLTDEQKDRLLERTERAEGFHPFRGLRGAPGGGGYYGVGGIRGAGRGGHSELDEVLNLTDEQQEAVKAVHETFRSDIRSLKDAKDAGELSDEAFVRTLMDLRNEKRAALDEILTDDQRTALEQFRSERQSDFQEFRAAVREVRDEVLGLSTDEADTFNGILEDQMDAREVLLEQFEAGEIALSTLQAEVEVLRDATTAALDSLLTDAQFEVVQLHMALAVRVGLKGHRRNHGRRR